MANRHSTATRAALFALALAVPAGSALSAPAAAPAQQDRAQQDRAQQDRAQQDRAQVPGYYRMALGGVQVTALYDGYIDLDPNLLSGLPAEDIEALFARMFQRTEPGVQTAVNAFLVDTGSRLVLVDVGAAGGLGPTLGGLGDNIRAAGYDPAQVDTVLLTHLHPDHAAGLLKPDGTPLFPEAEVRVAEAEAGFWLDEERAADAPAELRPFFEGARAAVAPYRAAGRFETFSPGEEPVPGIEAVPASGHTPGHTGYLVTSGGESLLVWGDIIHSHAVQFARPEAAIEFDVDKEQAVATRRKILADAAEGRLWVAGAHLPFPGIGHVRAEGDGYAWVPVEYGPIRTDR